MGGVPTEADKAAAEKLKADGEWEASRRTSTSSTSSNAVAPRRRSQRWSPAITRSLAHSRFACAAGNGFFKQKQHLKAAGCYTKAARKDPTNPVYQSNLAAALIGLAKFDKAVKASEACLKLDAENEKGHYRLACALLGAERFDEAVVEFEETSRINDGNKEAKKKLMVAVRGSLTAHKEAGTEPPEGVAKYKKVKTEAEVAAAEKRKAAKAQERQDAAKFKFPEGRQADPAAAAAGGEEGGAAADGQAAGEKEAAVSSLFSTEGTGEVSQAEDIDAAMQRLAEGDEVPYATDRVARFMALELAELCKPENAKSYAFPIAIFLPGTEKEGWGDEGQGVGMRACFDSATTHSNAIPFLRQYAEKTKAHAMLMVAAKSQIAFPQVWKRKDKPWPYGDAAGYFVQLDARKSEDRRVWFIEVAGTEAKPEYRRHMLDEAMYAFLQPVLKPMLMETQTIPRDFKADQAAQGNLSMLPPEPEPEVAVSDEDFEEAPSFGGAREGWYYKMGANGLGYYRDSSTGSTDRV
jgi:tetratricopeptide (TPR) repeat protein